MTDRKRRTLIVIFLDYIYLGKFHQEKSWAGRKLHMCIVLIRYYLGIAIKYIGNL